MRRGRAALAGASAVTVAALVAILTLPAFNSARRAASDSTSERTSWRRIAALLRERPDAAGLPFGGTDGIQALHYIGKVDFSVQLGARDAARPASLLRSLPPGILSGDTLDFYVDAPVTTTPEAIRRRFAGHPAVLIAMDSMRVTFNNVSPALLTAVRREGEELCQGRCGSMRLYRWPLDSTAAASP
jgi:hypothetical protein